MPTLLEPLVLGDNGIFWRGAGVAMKDGRLTEAPIPDDDFSALSSEQILDLIIEAKRRVEMLERAYERTRLGEIDRNLSFARAM
jgi:hypothetical protein